MLATISRCFELIGDRWRWRWFALLPLTLLTAGLELIGASAVFILIRLITDDSAATSIGVLAPLRDRLGITDGPTLAAVMAGAVAVLFLLKGILRLAEVYLRESWVHGALSDLATRMLSTYLDAPYSFHLRRNSAELARTLHDGVQIVCAVVLHALAIATNETLLAVAVVSVLLWVVPWASLSVALVVVVLAVATLSGSHRLTSDWGRRIHESIGSKFRLVQQGFGAAKEVKLLGRASYFVVSYRQALAQQEHAEVAWGTFQWLPRLTIETIFVCGLAALVIVAWFAETAPWQLAPTLGLFAFAGLRLLPSFHLILYHLNRIQLARAPVASVHEDYRKLELQQARETLSTPAAAFEHGIVLEQVSFVYEGETRRALSGIDCRIDKGESIGIVGSTGAGKSTLIDLLLGLLPPTSGRILVDGHDIREETTAWQRQIGYVPQQVFLLDDTIQANIAFAIDPREVDTARVAAVARMAQLQPWIDTLPARFETIVGERGVRVSGGERQRIAIARALYGDPAVLVFDEATAALDNHTEKELSTTIQGLQGHKTMLIVAHRLTTVRHCDRLLFLRDGCIVDVGSYDALLQRNPDFARLAAATPPSGDPGKAYSLAGPSLRP